MIINDIKANRLVSAATCIFMAVTAMLQYSSLRNRELLLWPDHADLVRM
jgi:hypothetical protein